MPRIFASLGNDARDNLLAALGRVIDGPRWPVQLVELGWEPGLQVSLGEEPYDRLRTRWRRTALTVHGQHLHDLPSKRSYCCLRFSRQPDDEDTTNEILWPFRFQGQQGLLVWTGAGCFSGGVQQRLAKSGHRLLTDDAGGLLAKLIESQPADTLGESLELSLAEVHGDYAVIAAIAHPVEQVIGASRGHRMIATQEGGWTLLTNDSDLSFRTQRAGCGRLVSLFEHYEGGQRYEVALHPIVRNYYEQVGEFRDDHRLLLPQAIAMDPPVSLEQRMAPPGYPTHFVPWKPRERARPQPG